MDIKHNDDGTMQAGVETDLEEFKQPEIDRHYICLIPGLYNQKSHDIAQAIAKAMNEKYSNDKLGNRQSD